MSTVTDAGVAATLTDGYAQYGYLAVGTGTPSDSGCGAEVERIPVATQNVNGRTRSLEAFFSNAEAVASLTEFAYMTAASGGTCLIYGEFSEMVVKTNTKGLLVTWSETWT